MEVVGAPLEASVRASRRSRATSRLYRLARAVSSVSIPDDQHVGYASPFWRAAASWRILLLVALVRAARSGASGCRSRRRTGICWRSKPSMTAVRSLPRFALRRDNRHSRQFRAPRRSCGVDSPEPRRIVALSGAYLPANDGSPPRIRSAGRHPSNQLSRASSTARPAHAAQRPAISRAEGATTSWSITPTSLAYRSTRGCRSRVKNRDTRPD